MSKNCPIMIRMKNKYESRSQTKLTRGVPVIIRLDGKAFHTYTKGLDKPFDEGLIEDMQNTAKYLCENIQGCKAAYTQSDEISLVLTDYDNINTEAWFDYKVQKMTSVAASLATAKFNQLRLLRNEEILYDSSHLEDRIFGYSNDLIENFKLAMFDARVFSVPKEDVNNYFVARQRDAVKNSVAMLAQSLYSHKELFKKNGSEMQEMCFQKDHNWNDLHFSKKRGSFVIKNLYVNNKLCQNKETYEIGDLWYQPDSNSVFYPSKYGRLLEYAIVDDPDCEWCDVPIKKIRSKWEVIETPEFSKSVSFINNLI